MQLLDLNPSRCARCLTAAARRRLAGRARPTSPARLQRLVRRASVTLTLAGLVAVPIAHTEEGPVLPAATAAAAAAPAAPAAATPALPPALPGYQLATVDGNVLPFGAAASAAGPAGLPNPVVGVARTPTGGGTWTVTADGGVLTAGDALFHGSLGGQHLTRPIVGIGATPSGLGYWLVGADGGVFAFGDAGFHGSLAGLPVNAPIVALVPTPGGNGYWLAAADGGVFTYGDAPFLGGVQLPLRAPIASMAAMPDGTGYWLVGRDGGVFTFGEADYHGGPNDELLRSPVVGIAPSRSGAGYWLASADGGVFTYGDAPFLGSIAGRAGKIVGIAAGTARLAVVPPAPAAPPPPAPGAISNRYGHDISWPQCDGPYPDDRQGHGIVGVTGGRPFTRNRCLASQWQWATANGSVGAVYVNLASPIVGDAAAMIGPAGACGPADLPCQTYNHSSNNMASALAYARESGVDAPMWWLDVEVLNRWSTNQALNALTVRAARETLEGAGLAVGVYSTPYQWRKITGGDRNRLPVWVAGAPTDADAPGWCTNPDKDFTGGGVWLVQSLPIIYDVNYACDPVLQRQRQAYRFRT